MYKLRYTANGGEEIVLDFDHGYIINTVEGATGRTVDVQTAQGFEQIGETVTGMSLGGQLLTINGRIPMQNTSAKRAMLRIFQPLSSGRLYWENKYYIDVVVRDSPQISQERHSTFLLALYAPYPYWQKANQSRYELGGLTAEFMFPINYATPHRFGSTTIETQFNAYNAGDCAASFTLTITAGEAALTNFAVTDVNTQKAIKFIGTLDAGKRIVMYRENGQLYIKIDGTTDAFDMLDDTSDLYSLAAGDNVLLFTADSGASSAKVSITFNESYVGVLADGV